VGLERIILKAMAKEVGDRYQSPDEVLRELKQLRASLSGATELLPSASITRQTSSAGPAVVAQNALRLRWVQILLVAVPLLIIATWIALRLWIPRPTSQPQRRSFLRSGSLIIARRHLFPGKQDAESSPSRWILNMRRRTRGWRKATGNKQHRASER